MKIIWFFVLKVSLTVDVLNGDSIFEKDEQHIVARNGSEALLRCYILVNLNISQYLNVSWIKSPRQILTRGFFQVTENARFKLQPPGILNTQHFNLQISPVVLEDEGIYRCNFIYGRKIFVKTVNLTVQAAPVISRHPSPMVKVEESNELKLTCAAFGKPKPNIAWYLLKNAYSHPRLVLVQNVLGIYNPDVSVSDGNLYVAKSNRSMRGTYRCVASNGLGTAKWDVKVLILYSPEIYMANEIITQNMNQDTVVMCTLSSYPLGILTWYFDPGNVTLKTHLCGIINEKSMKYCMVENRYIPDNGEVKMTSKLTLFNLQKRDFGTYSCKSQTIMGFAKGSTEVKVTPVFTIESDLIPMDYKYKPQSGFLKQSQNAHSDPLTTEGSNRKYEQNYEAVVGYQNSNKMQNNKLSCQIRPLFVISTMSLLIHHFIVLRN